MIPTTHTAHRSHHLPGKPCCMPSQVHRAGLRVLPPCCLAVLPTVGRVRVTTWQLGRGKRAELQSLARHSSP